MKILKERTNELNFEKLLQQKEIENKLFRQKIKDHSHTCVHISIFYVTNVIILILPTSSKVDLLSEVRWLSSWFVIFFNVT